MCQPLSQVLAGATTPESMVVPSSKGWGLGRARMKRCMKDEFACGEGMG